MDYFSFLLITWIILAIGTIITFFIFLFNHDTINILSTFLVIFGINTMILFLIFFHFIFGVGDIDCMDCYPTGYYLKEPDFLIPFGFGLSSCLLGFYLLYKK